jgi:hypothetical protein
LNDIIENAVITVVGSSSPFARNKLVEPVGIVQQLPSLTEQTVDDGRIAQSLIP